MTNSAPTSRATSQNSYSNLVLLLASKFSHEELMKLTRIVFGSPGSGLRSQFRQDNAQYIVDIAVRDHKLQVLLDECKKKASTDDWPSLVNCRELEQPNSALNVGSNPSLQANRQLPLDRVYLEDIRSKPSERATIEEKNSAMIVIGYSVFTVVFLLFALLCYIGGMQASALTLLVFAALSLLVACDSYHKRSKWRQMRSGSETVGKVIMGWKQQDLWTRKDKYYFAFRFYTPASDDPYDVQQDIDQSQFERMYLGQNVQVYYGARNPYICHAFIDKQRTQQP